VRLFFLSRDESAHIIGEDLLVDDGHALLKVDAEVYLLNFAKSWARPETVGQLSTSEIRR